MSADGNGNSSSALDDKRILIFIPALNEEESVGAVVGDVLAALPGCDVLVIDDGSSDRTAARARAAGASVASLPFNQGLGAALQTGYLQALREGYDACAHLDSDGQHRVSDLKRLLAPIVAGDADLVIGSRYLDRDDRDGDDAEGAAEVTYKPSLPRAVGSAIFRRALSVMVGSHFSDVTSGFRAAGPRAIALFSYHYEADYAELESLQRATRQKLRIREIAVTMLPRAAGESKITTVQAIFFSFKALVVLGIGSLRRERHIWVSPEPEDAL